MTFKHPFISFFILDRRSKSVLIKITLILILSGVLCCAIKSSRLLTIEKDAGIEVQEFIDSGLLTAAPPVKIPVCF